MWTGLLYIISGVAFVAAVRLAWFAFKVRRETREKLQQLTWIREQATRALEMVNSEDENQVITGLQTLSVLKERGSRLAALHRVAELTRSINPTIAEHAETAFKRISPVVTGGKPEAR